MIYATLTFLVLLSILLYAICFQMLPSINIALNNIVETPRFDKFKLKYYIMLTLLIPPSLVNSRHNFNDAPLGNLNSVLIYATYASILLLFIAVYYYKTPAEFLKKAKINANSEKTIDETSILIDVQPSCINIGEDSKRRDENNSLQQRGLKKISEIKATGNLMQANLEADAMYLEKNSSDFSMQAADHETMLAFDRKHIAHDRLEIERVSKKLENLEKKISCDKYEEMSRGIAKYETAKQENRKPLRRGRGFSQAELAKMDGTRNYALHNFAHLLPKSETIQWTSTHCSNGLPDKIGLAIFIIRFFNYDYKGKSNQAVMSIADYYFDIINGEGAKNHMDSKTVTEAKKKLISSKEAW